MSASIRQLLAYLTSLTVLGICSCSQMATVKLHDGRRFDGRTLGTDGKQQMFEAWSGEVVKIDRKYIKDVDHPGDAETIAGFILIGVGTFFAVPLLLADCGEPDRDVSCEDRKHENRLMA